MGIKDKVLNILFDDEEESKNTQINRKHKEYDASSLLNTSPVFIDVNPTNRNNNISNTHSTDSIPSNYIKEEIKEINDTSEYTYTANISPIFGVVDKKTKSKIKNNSKIKNYSGVGDKKNNPGSTTQQSIYNNIILSPIFGPLVAKESKRTNRARKKEEDDFTRNIDDTGSFEVGYEEVAQDEMPDFNEAVEDETFVESEIIGDTDRLERISDRINQIKNEAANIYYNDDEQNDEITNVEDKPILVDNSISNLIHNFQLEDYDATLAPTSKPFSQSTNHEKPVLTNSINNEESEPEINYDETSKEVYSEPMKNTFENSIIENSQELSFEDNEDTYSDSLIKPNEEEPVNNEISQNARINEPNYNNQNSVSTSNTSIDDLFQDEDDDEKDLFSELFGDDL